MAKKVSENATLQKIAKKTPANAKKVCEKPKKRNQGISSTVFAKRIRAALQSQNRLTPEIEITVMLAANALHIWSRTTNEIKKVDLWCREESKYGFKIVEHPVFKTHREYIKKVHELLKTLGLTADDIVNKEQDALSDFDRELEE
ncbi:MAG: hypothetical protein J6U69_03635 [Alistipes sp.]|nr:hypothetical protein [Alistipes sp.]